MTNKNLREKTQDGKDIPIKWELNLTGFSIQRTIEDSRCWKAERSCFAQKVVRRFPDIYAKY